MDDAAFLKSALHDQMLHHMIIFVGIYTQMADLLLAKCYCRRKYTMHRPVPGNAVERPIFCIRKPSALFNPCICRIISDDKCEHAMYRFILYVPYDVQMPGPDILRQQAFRRKAVLPLGSIARLLHKPSGPAVDLRCLPD